VDKVLGYIRRGEEEGAHLLTVSRDLQAGRIWVNTTIDGGPQLPAGGFKASGFGREMGYAGLEEFTEIKSILYRLGKREPYFGSDWSR
jgi:acyl-CoA reductase-like NAD-dependent aldehyde dehydrogenase